MSLIIFLLRLCLLVFVVGTGSAFAPPLETRRCPSSGRFMTKQDASLPFCRQRSILHSTQDDNEETTSALTEEPVAPPPQEEPESKYPINLPSPILLASSVILAIAGTGMYDTSMCNEVYQSLIAHLLLSFF